MREMLTIYGLPEATCNVCGRRLLQINRTGTWEYALCCQGEHIVQPRFLRVPAWTLKHRDRVMYEGVERYVDTVEHKEGVSVCVHWLNGQTATIDRLSPIEKRQRKDYSP